MVAVWLMGCLILRTSYTSSLVSHLVVQGKSTTINNFEDLVALQRQGGWKWGTHTFSGAFNLLLSSSENPYYHFIKDRMQARIDNDEAVQKILAGRFSYVRNYYGIRIITESYTTAGENPLHIGTARYPLFAGNTFAFRWVARGLKGRVGKRNMMME
ncbi:uncharacterized protein LOC126983136 [Eriocheir sinensis]|uniref:uncharacterized protein LOC126983136 n=1 Tax=Eriocheir sinensis TaxID=95602 RepID=UPI0021CA81D9|nr:uncharacterized protein LOC126983136 [Eriocheir sinensis]